MGSCSIAQGAQLSALTAWRGGVGSGRESIHTHKRCMYANGKEPACQGRRHKRHRFDPWVRKIPWRGKWQPTPVLLPGKSHGQRRLAGYSPWGRKEWDTTEQPYMGPDVCCACVCPRISSQQPHKGTAAAIPHFTGEKVESQSGRVTCLK